MEPTPIATRAIPASGELLPILGIGTWQAFDVNPMDPARKSLTDVLQQLWSLGGTVVDTSPMYGRAESVIGNLSTAAGLNEKFFMATKVWTRGEKEGIRQMENSMSLLRRTVIDLMQIHNLVDWKSHLKTLYKWKEQGRIRYVGITHYTESGYDGLEEVMKAYSLDFVQVNYSIVSRQAERRLFPLALDKGIAVLVNRPLETAGLFRRVIGKKLPEWAGEIGCSNWSSFFLKFVLSHPAVTCAIPATSNPVHLLENMEAGKGPLPDSKARERMAGLIK